MVAVSPPFPQTWLRHWPKQISKKMGQPTIGFKYLASCQLCACHVGRRREVVPSRGKSIRNLYNYIVRQSDTISIYQTSAYCNIRLIINKLIQQTNTLLITKQCTAITIPTHDHNGSIEVIGTTEYIIDKWWDDEQCIVRYSKLRTLKKCNFQTISGVWIQNFAVDSSRLEAVHFF